MEKETTIVEFQGGKYTAKITTICLVLSISFTVPQSLHPKVSVAMCYRMWEYFNKHILPAFLLESNAST